MKQEDKNLLIKDLCGRLQYGLKCSIYRVDDFGVGWRDDTLKGAYFDDYGCEFYFDDYVCVDSINKVKPYLLPLSSMTEEQEEEYNTMYEENRYSWRDNIIDWFDRNHFDYRGLIDRGLAIDATGKNIYS